jgi:hypothetical protein
MSVNTAEFAWESAERRCFNYLNKTLGTIPDIQGFIATFPKAINATSSLVLWTFEINGGGGVVQIQANQAPSASWHLGARLRGLFTERTTAQEFCGRIKNILPYEIRFPDPLLENILRFSIADNPTLEQDVIPIQDDVSDIGGDYPIWRLEWGLSVAFTNSERLT